MTASIPGRIFVLFAACLMIAGAASAGWIENGVVINNYSGNQLNPHSTPDGSGGAFIAWEDYRSSNYDIYVQRVDDRGEPLWTPDGVAVCVSGGSQYVRGIVTDGAGGAIIVWDDSRSGGSWDIYAQRIDADGTPLWTSNGVIVCDETDVQYHAVIISDDLGGAIIAWEDFRSGDLDIYAQRITSNGIRIWNAAGAPVCTFTGSQSNMAIASDGNNGAIITWQDFRSVDNYDIYAQRLSYAAGGYWWTLDGVVICDATYSQINPRIAAGFGNDAMITWMDWRNGQYDIYCQRVTGGGSVMYTTSGAAVCDDISTAENPEIIADGEGGAFVIWEDHRNSGDTDRDVYAQRIDIAGNPQWTANGIVVCDAYFDQYFVKMVSDGDGGFIAVWEDWRLGSRDIAAQRISATGNAEWLTDGVFLCRGAASQLDLAIVSDGEGGAIAAWEDTRGTTYDIYAQRIERNGYWGYPAPSIESVRDVPGDQGGYVNLAWNASRLDEWSDDLISYYSLWRAIEETAALSSAASGVPMLTVADEFTPDIPVGSIRTEILAGEPFYWELITTVDAYNLETYSRILETAFDSTDASAEFSYYQVMAHINSSTFWLSLPDSGYSVDNLAPAIPMGLAGEQVFTPEGLQLTWDPNTESDLAGYNIYRGTSSGFVPGPGNFVTSTPDTATFDDSWSWEEGYWYKVAAVDIHGNESPFSVVGPDAVTGDDPMPLPGATFLSQNWPNPFNPSTTVAFGMKESGHVSLRIYDAAGRLVSVLIDESRPAGQYSVVWNGKDRSGNQAASGVYFYMLRAGTFEETKKMVLLK